MRTIPTDLQTHIALEVTALTECMSIKRTDGSIVRMTTFDDSIVVDGDIYRAEASYSRSALQSTDNLTVDNAEATIVLDEVFMKKADFESGLYDNAAFEMFIINYEHPEYGIISLKRGTLGDITFNGENNVTVQLRGLTQALQKTIVEKYSPTCRVNLGGEKCGIVNTPTRVRRDRQRVKTFDWYLVPQTSTPVTVTNPSFEADGAVSDGTSGISGWTYGSTSHWKTGTVFTAGVGTYYLEGGAADAIENVLYQDITTATIGLLDANVDNGNYSIDLSALIASTSNTFANQGLVYLEQLDADGNTLLLQESKLTTPVYHEWEGIGATSFLLPGCRTVRVGIKTKRLEGTSATVAFDAIKLRYWTNALATFGSLVFRTLRIPARGTTEKLTISNGSFEADGNVANGISGITGWTQGAGNFWKVNTSFSGFSPIDGTHLLGGGDNSTTTANQVYHLSQIVSIPSPPTGDNVTAGWYYGEFSIKVGRIDTDSDPRLVLEFLDSSNTVLATYDTGYDTTSAISVWYDMRVGGKMPATATKMRINLYARGDSDANVVFDAASVLFAVTAYEHPNDAEYGLLSSAQPAYTYTADEYTVDGDAVVQARAPHFAYGAVTDVTNLKVFEDTSINMTTALRYSGKITWLSGNNAGRISFVRVWDNTSKIVTLYQPLPYEIQIGDKYVYAPGCDKTLARCFDPFGNVTNMRAEPYLPGQQRVIEFLRGN